MLIPSRLFAVATAMVVCCVSGALADGPATQASSPTASFKAFVMDIRHGDSADLPGLSQASAPDAQALLRDFQAIAVSIQRLRAAVTQKFGPSFADTVMPDMPSEDDLDNLTQTIGADHAQVHGDSVGTITMVNVDGKWKFDVDAMRHGPDFPPNPNYFHEMARAIGRTADDIAAGKLDTPEGANEALEARRKAIADDVPAATQP